jgi:hypothetical protein
METTNPSFTSFVNSFHRRYVITPRNYDLAVNSPAYAAWLYPPEQEDKTYAGEILLSIAVCIIGLVIYRLA